jgi:hypothetical protein
MTFTPKAFLGGLKYTFVEDRTVAYLNMYVSRYFGASEAINLCRYVEKIHHLF